MPVGEGEQVPGTRDLGTELLVEGTIRVVLRGLCCMTKAISLSDASISMRRLLS